jgi:hypothetical protein
MTVYTDHQCTQCGRQWSTKYFSYYVCPGCTRVPRLRRMWLRLKYRLLGKTWGKRQGPFIATRILPDSMDTIGVSTPLADLLDREATSEEMKVGSIIHIPGVGAFNDDEERGLDDSS